MQFFREKACANSFGLDRIDFFKELVFGYPVWQYLATIVWFSLAILVSWLAGWLIIRQLTKISEKTATRVDDEFVRHMRKPIRLAIFVLCCYFGIPLFEWPEGVTTFLQTVLAALIALTIAYGVMKSLDFGFRLLELRSEGNNLRLRREMFPVFRKVCKAIIFLIAVLMFLDNMGINIKAVLTGLGIGGLAIALAAQDILANFFASLVIIFDSPYRVGEKIRAKGHEGTVEAIGLRSTRLRTADGTLVSIPNRQMADTDVNNLSRVRK
jgi:MscS family membrane protein